MFVPMNQFDIPDTVKHFRYPISNTETPYYYACWREKVLSGEIPVCETISMEMNRIDALVANPLYYYDRNVVEGWIRYCENELVLTYGAKRFLDGMSILKEACIAQILMAKADVM